MNYHYHLSYDENDDSFFAYVDDGTKAGRPVFQIDNTEELSEYIKTGQMSHIDDTEGLETFLKTQGFLQPEDSLLLSEELLW